MYDKTRSHLNEVDERDGPSVGGRGVGDRPFEDVLRVSPRVGSEGDS